MLSTTRFASITLKTNMAATIAKWVSPKYFLYIQAFHRTITLTMTTILINVKRDNMALLSIIIRILYFGYQSLILELYYFISNSNS